MLKDRLPEQHADRTAEVEEEVRDTLVGLGLQEAITYSLTEPERESPLGAGQGAYVELLNPISTERRVMRHTVLAGLLQIAAANLRHDDEIRLFELGPVYLPHPGEKLPDEPRRLALVLSGHREVRYWEDGPGQELPALDFFDLKGIVESLVASLHLPEVSYRLAAAPYLHPGRAAELLIRGTPAGHFGQMHPKTAESYNLGQRTVLVGELDLEKLLAAAPARFAYASVPRFPAALRDIAVVVEESVPASRVEAEIRVAGGDLLRGMRLFDVYKGESIPPGTRSLAYALSYQTDRTLTDKEIDRAHKKIEERLKRVLKAKIRGEE
jgi:phenylalanyl-tRNA synthetase beta chain